MFTEHHNLHVNLTHYGLPERGYNVIGDRIQAMMNSPSCTLKINWRNFWNSCGDAARYVWSGKSLQATGMNESKMVVANAEKAAPKKQRNKGRRRYAR